MDYSEGVLTTACRGYSPLGCDRCSHMLVLSGVNAQQAESSGYSVSSRVLPPSVRNEGGQKRHAQYHWSTNGAEPSPFILYCTTDPAWPVPKVRIGNTARNRYRLRRHGNPLPEKIRDSHKFLIRETGAEERNLREARLKLALNGRRRLVEPDP